MRKISQYKPTYTGISGYLLNIFNILNFEKKEYV